MEFYSGQPENPAASVRDYCTGVLIETGAISISFSARSMGVHVNDAQNYDKMVVFVSVRGRHPQDVFH
jgi:hypothetical protein